MNIVVVDDEPMIAMLLRIAFERDGHHVLEVTKDFPTLLRAVFGWDMYDALLCDLMLPGVTGVEIIQAAKARNPKLRTVALTAGHHGSQLTREARKVADQVLLKPQPLEQIITAVCGAT